MANVLTVNPVVIDTVAADVVISTGVVRVHNIAFDSNAAPGKVVFIDNMGYIKFVLEVTAAAGGVDRQDFDKPVWVEGLTVDQSASTFPAGSTLLVYV